MQLPSDVSFELLDRYFAGVCTPSEAIQVREALISSPELAALHRAIIGDPVDVESAWTKFTQSPWMQEGAAYSGSALQQTSHSDISLTETWVGAKSGHSKWSIMSRGFWYRVVPIACVAVLVAISWGSLGNRVVRAGSSATAYATGNGERADVTLPDGNTVSLNVASRLDVPADYRAGNHTVRLTGEAVFRITHHNSTPFTVTTQNLSTRVLGTTFVVRRYSTDTATVVAVRDGKVSVRSMVITAGSQVELGNSGSVRVLGSDPARFSFAAGVLAVNGVSLQDAIPDLNRWYDADIRLGDQKLAARRITGGFTAGNISDLVELLNLTLNVRVARNGRTITLFQR